MRSGPLASVPIHPRQHAFQAGKSTESALHQLVGRIEKALDAKEYSLGVFFDIEGAFDNTSCKSVKLALDEWKVHRSVRNWIVTMLARRTIIAKAETFAIVATALCGLPQGGGLSPILWSLVADSLLKWLSKQGTFAQGYADDGAVLICGRILSTICDISLMQRILYGIEQWCIKRELSVNPSKTEMVLFTRRYKPEKLKTIKFFNNTLAASSQVKYLGVILDPKLDWKQHVEGKCKKALALLCQLRRVTGATWGMTPKTVLWLYTPVIRPYISYAAVVWWPRIKMKTVNNQLEHIQRLACLYTTGAMRTTPNSSPGNYCWLKSTVNIY